MPWLGIPALATAGGGGAAVAGGGAAAATATTATLQAAAVIGTAVALDQLSKQQLQAMAAAPAFTPDQYAERLRKARDLANDLTRAAAASCATGNCCQRVIIISRSAAPESVQHIEDAQRAGFPRTLTYGGSDAAAKSAARGRRRRSTSSVPRIPGYEPDEYPPAAFLENGGHASVRNINWRDNRVAGGIMGANLVGVPAGCRITIVTGP